MRISVIMHADFETPGVIEVWARDKKHKLSIFKPYQAQLLPTTEEFDFLIVMGGPQSPLDLEEAPYLKDEIELINKAIQTEKIVLGFCLGAQLIGEALGGKTERSPEKEIGIHPVSLTPEGLKDDLFKRFPKTFNVIHWHNDMPGLTKDAQLLAFSEGCPRQAIRYGARVYGFQFHMEITQQGIAELIKACPDDLRAGKFVQSPEILMNQSLEDIHQYMYLLLDQIVDKGVLN
ncbi:hypothetical protein IM40_06665 [Candidatus Paracaedimonas acanthamoebae]|nr:hypothetical protein IM40_06665 [Candidatus Paracaedimonas acanthamoebae]